MIDLWENRPRNKPPIIPSRIWFLPGKGRDSIFLRVEFGSDVAQCGFVKGARFNLLYDPTSNEATFVCHLAGDDVGWSIYARSKYRVGAKLSISEDLIPYRIGGHFVLKIVARGSDFFRAKWPLP